MATGTKGQCAWLHAELTLHAELSKRWRKAQQLPWSLEQARIRLRKIDGGSMHEMSIYAPRGDDSKCMNEKHEHYLRLNVTQ